MDLLKVLWDDFKAWRRGDHRIAPRFDVNGRVVSGRVYARRGESPAGVMPAKTKLVGHMSLRVYRAATDTWEVPMNADSVEVEVR